MNIAPERNCDLCKRLAEFRQANVQQYPSFYNAPVPAFGELDAELLIVGLAPGLKGANQSGRPFTGDYAGIILYSALQKYAFAQGEYDPAKFFVGGKDGFSLNNCRVTNSVRCVPPDNKPTPSEITTCNNFLSNEIAAMKRLKVIVSLGQIAHKSVISIFNRKQADYKFAHAAKHKLENIILLNSFHTSRYNINTGRLSQAMFDDVIGEARNLIA
ncbi:MAG: uracil-DNA glycosylase [Pseudomonadota bacterium]